MFVSGAAMALRSFGGVLPSFVLEASQLQCIEVRKGLCSHVISAFVCACLYLSLANSLFGCSMVHFM